MSTEGYVRTSTTWAAGDQDSQSAPIRVNVDDLNRGWRHYSQSPTGLIVSVSRNGVGETTVLPWPDGAEAVMVHVNYSTGEVSLGAIEEEECERPTSCDPQPVIDAIDRLVNESLEEGWFEQK